ncbi:MAG TPA: orotidine-5'-phosphate decarboxylase [Acidimicrobiales bacterium]|nr:orotidine-5'-phosphate decarboxylase [Acidimicrobiales bacterium]
MTVDTTTDAAVPEALRARLALALDVDDLVAAVRLARDLQPWFGTMKVGMELFAAAGPDAIVSLSQLGVDVFYDGKLHDIPNTVGRTARVLGALGARYVTLHTSGGVAMLRAGVQGLREGALGAGLPEPTALAVTVLTSDPDWSEHLVRQRAVAGLEAGCGGFVCSVPDLPILRELAPAATIVTPGIRPAGASADDQARVATPQAALDGGADLLVIGRAVVASDSPIEATRSLVAGLS